MSFKIKIKDNINELFKTSSNITGLSKITNEYNIEPMRKNSYSIEQNSNTKILKNKIINNEMNDKIELIKNMIKNHSIKQPYDGYAIKSKKFTIEYLLQKSIEKENKAIFEKNNLCKANYPLIKFLSNRKMKNRTKKLLLQMLNTEYGELTKEERNTIKYESYKRKFVNDININKNTLTKKHSQKNLRIPKLKQDKNHFNLKRNDLNSFFKNHKIKEKINLTHNNFWNFSLKNKNFDNNINDFMIYNNNRPETERAYPNLGFGETVKLDYHEAIKKNNNILLNRIIRKKYMNPKGNTTNYINNEIINDISKLKSNNKIMHLNTNMITI
jgi:hypothetical protein